MRNMYYVCNVNVLQKHMLFLNGSILFGRMGSLVGNKEFHQNQIFPRLRIFV